MARKVMTCKSAPEIELCFDGGEAILLRFDIRCLMELQALEGGLAELANSGIAESAAKILYAAGAGINENYDESKAKEIVSNMSIDNIIEIVNTFSESMGNIADDEAIKKMVAQFLNKKTQK